MADERPDFEGERRKRPSVDVPPSVLNVLSSRLGEAPRVSLREEDSATVGAPPIDPSSDERQALPEGRGSYQVLGEIARGGMGVVLRGHDTDLGRDVAMKVLSKDLADRPEIVQRFVEEAQIGGQLQHPGIVPVYELGLMADERPYFTMKLVKGRTLATLLAERETTASDRRRLIDVFESTCQTMAYAHSRGVIHRDLKPANVMVGAFGEVQVVDWGLAKVLARGGVEDERRAKEVRTELTVLETVRSEGSGSGTDSLVGSVMGTPSYMPPEQASGRVDRLDERADVFALGAILCEILTGAPPYSPDTGTTLQQAAGAELDDALARLEASDAEPELVKVATQCLMAAPAARPRNAGVVAESVQRFLEGQDARSRAAQVEAAEARVRATQERKARRLTLALAGSVLVTLVVGGGGWIWTSQQRAERRADELAREGVLAEGVNEALNEARLLAARERWDDARSAGQRAAAIAAAGDAGPELHAAVGEVLGEVEAAAREASEREALALDTARLLEELRSALNPMEINPLVHRSVQRVAAYDALPGIFAAHGVDVEASEPDALAEELGRRGLGAELAMLLDMWASARRLQEDEAGALRLLEVAHLVDPDPLRADLREAAANGDVEMLRTLADEDLARLNPATIELLVVSLQRLEELTLAVEVLDRAVLVHPEAPGLHRRLVDLVEPGGGGPLLSVGDRRRGRKALLHALAAASLEPDSPADRFDVGIFLMRLGEHRGAAEALERAIAMSPESPFPRLGLASALSDVAGEEARALEILQGLQLNSGGPIFRYWVSVLRAKLLYRSGDLEGARAAQQDAIATLPNRTPRFTELHARLLEAGDLQSSEGLLWGRLAGSPSISDNNVAWALANADPDAIGDPEAYRSMVEDGVAIAQGAADRTPLDSNSWNTLAVARLSAGDHRGALEAAERSVELAGGVGISTDWLVLSVCHAELGDPDRAREWFERSRAHLDGSIDVALDSTRTRLARQAAALLGIPFPARR